MTIDIHDCINNFLCGRKKQIELRFLEDGRFFSCLFPSDCVNPVAKEILLMENYEWLPEFELHNFKGKNIIDAGAHVGLFSIKASSYARKILAIEPHPRNHLLLRLNIERNRIPNIKPINKALCFEKANLFLLERERSTRHQVSSNWDDNSFRVHAITLRELFESLDAIHLLKLDIEGSEWKLLMNAHSEELEKVEYIVGELHMRNKTQKDREEFCKKLKNKGYEVTFYRYPPLHSLRRVIKNFPKTYGLMKLKSFSILSVLYRKKLYDYIFFAAKV